MKSLSPISSVLPAALFVAAALAAPPSAGYHLLRKIPIGGEGGWDYLTVDEQGRRVYVSHASQVEVLDADALKPVGKIPGTKGVHGIAIAGELGRGFTSNGQAGTVTIFDLKTLQPVGEVAVGKNPDGIRYEPVSRRVFALNAESNSATVIDAADGKVAATLELGGRPEGSAVDGKGTIFIGLRDTDILLKVDAREMKIQERWAVGVAGCPDPGNMAMDPATRRLFIRCKDRSKTTDCCVMGVVNADNGKLIATVPIGDRADSASFDPATRLIFFPDGNGKVTIIHEESADRYTLVENVPTESGARTMALDLKTHRLFLSTAQSGPTPPATAAEPNPRPPIVPGTFAVLVLSP